MAVATSNYFKIESKAERRYRDVPHVLFQKAKNIALTLPPEIEDRFSLVAGLDQAHFAIDGDKVVLTFSRRGSAVAT